MAHSHKRIGLLGGSFDPVHNGHISIAQSFLQSGYIDELWILLTPDPPHKPDRTLTDYQVRLEMLQAAFKGMESVRVSDIEGKLPEPSYTIQTLAYLEKEYPDHDFFLCLGGDSLENFKQWKSWQQILERCNLLVAQRPSNGVTISDDQIKQNTFFVDHQPIEISSTMIREAHKNGKSISEWVPKSVLAIITQKQLYV